jgi:hypothetical protein
MAYDPVNGSAMMILRIQKRPILITLWVDSTPSPVQELDPVERHGMIIA